MEAPAGRAEGLLEGILNLDLLITGSNKMIKKWQKVRSEKLKLLAEEVRAGNSTGNPLVDFVVLHSGLIGDQDIADGPVAEYVKELYDRCSRAKDEPVLVVRREIKIDDFRPRYFSESCGLTEDGLVVSGQRSFVPPPTHRSVNYLVSFGVLSDSGLFFDLDEKKAYLLSDSWSMVNSADGIVKPSPSAVVLGDGSQELALPPLANLIMAKSNPGCSPHWSVVVGCQAVKDWVSDCEDFRIHGVLSKWFKLHFDAEEESEPEKDPPADNHYSPSD
ncbi:MAG: hypothetical protein WC517_00040 [Patescibacteria group bacterium]